MPKCSLKRCGNQRSRTLRLFSFPLDPEICRKWVEFAERPDLKFKAPISLNRHYYLCERHFEVEPLSQTTKNGNCISKPQVGTVPTIKDTVDDCENLKCVTQELLNNNLNVCKDPKPAISASEGKCIANGEYQNLVKETESLKTSKPSKCFVLIRRDFSDVNIDEGCVRLVSESPSHEFSSKTDDMLKENRIQLPTILNSKDQPVENPNSNSFTSVGYDVNCATMADHSRALIHCPCCLKVENLKNKIVSKNRTINQQRRTINYLKNKVKLLNECGTVERNKKPVKNNNDYNIENAMEILGNYLSTLQVKFIEAQLHAAKNGYSKNVRWPQSLLAIGRALRELGLPAYEELSKILFLPSRATVDQPERLRGLDIYFNQPSNDDSLLNSLVSDVGECINDTDLNPEVAAAVTVGDKNNTEVFEDSLCQLAKTLHTKIKVARVAPHGIGRRKRKIVDNEVHSTMLHNYNVNPIFDPDLFLSLCLPSSDDHPYGSLAPGVRPPRIKSKVLGDQRKKRAKLSSAKPDIEDFSLSELPVVDETVIEESWSFLNSVDIDDVSQLSC